MNGAGAAGGAPAASVIVLAYNAAGVVRRALGSLRRQTIAAPFEVIVVWSGDPAAAAIARDELPGAIVVGRPERLLTGAARNLGLARASGDIVAFLAADCVAAPDWLEQRVAAHRAGHDLVGGAVVWSEPANALGRAAHLLEYNSVPPGRPRAVVDSPVYNLSYRRAVLERFGRFDETLPCGEDTALVWELAGAGMPFLFDPAIRIAHPGSASLRGFWRHQEWHGYWLGRLSRRRRVPGLRGSGLARSLRLVALYPAARLWRMGGRLARWQRDWARQAVALAPLLLLGVAAATLGLVRGLRYREAEERPRDGAVGALTLAEAEDAVRAAPARARPPA